MITNCQLFRADDFSIFFFIPFDTMNSVTCSCYSFTAYKRNNQGRSNYLIFRGIFGKGW